MRWVKVHGGVRAGTRRCVHGVTCWKDTVASPFGRLPHFPPTPAYKPFWARLAAPLLTPTLTWSLPLFARLLFSHASFLDCKGLKTQLS